MGRAGGRGNLVAILSAAVPSYVVRDAVLRHAGVEVVLIPADHRLRVARLLHSVDEAQVVEERHKLVGFGVPELVARRTRS